MLRRLLRTALSCAAAATAAAAAAIAAPTASAALVPSGVESECPAQSAPPLLPRQLDLPSNEGRLFASMSRRKQVLSVPAAVAAAFGGVVGAVAPLPSLAAPPQTRTAGLATGPICGGPLPLTVGLGTCLVSDSDVERQVLKAIEAGYRVIDTAQRYANENGVGRGIRAAIDGGLVKREELFVTTKVWVTKMGRDKTSASVVRSASDLGLDTIDLVLVHWPGYFGRRGSGYDATNPRLRRETWEELQMMRSEGIAGQIGVSNFSERHLTELLGYGTTRVRPAVNQIEVHPYNARDGLIEFCNGEGILVEAYSPLGGKGNKGQVTDTLLADPVLGGIASRHGRTVAQTILRWHLQRGVTPIPKASSGAHLRENVDVFDFELDYEEMSAIGGLNRDRFAVLDGDALA